MRRLIIVCLQMFVVLSFMSAKPVSASNIISTFHDAFDGQALGPNYFSDTNSSNSYYIIDNGILTINSGSQDGGGRWISSNQTYSYSPGSHSLIFETRARIDPGERHFSVGLIGGNHDGAFLFSDPHATGHLHSVVNAIAQTAPTQLIDQVDIAEWHVYRFEVACSIVKFYVDDILRTVHDNANAIPSNKPLRIIFDKGSQGTPSTLYIDYVDLNVVEENCPSQPQITSANLNIYTDIVGTEDGSYEDLPYGFEVFVQANGEFSAINPEDIDLAVEGNPLSIEQANATPTGNLGEYRVFATGHFPSGQTPALGTYTITMEDANGLISSPFSIGQLNDYPRSAPLIVYPQHQSVITESEPTFEWEQFETDYHGQPIIPTCGVMLYNFEYDYFTSLLPLGQTSLTYLNPYWHPSQPPQLVPERYSWAVGCDIANVAPGFDFSYHRTVDFIVTPPNQLPIVDAGGPYSVSADGSVVITASGDDPEGGSLIYDWDLDDNGTFEAPGQNVTFSAVSLEALSSHTITVRVTDNGGLSATDQAIVNVIYNFNGFFQPIDNLPTVNVIPAGKAVAVKFSLNGDQGMNIMASGYPTSSTVSCGSTAEDAVEQTLTAGSNSLSYEANTDQYIYIWKTDKAWAGTCRTLIIKLSDGTYHRANFKFK